MKKITITNQNKLIGEANKFFNELSDKMDKNPGEHYWLNDCDWDDLIIGWFMAKGCDPLTAKDYRGSVNK